MSSEHYKILKNKIKHKNFVDERYQKNEPQRKYFIILYGAQASGKGSLYKHYMSDLDINSSDTVTIDVDKYVVKRCKELNGINQNHNDCDNIGQEDYFIYREFASELSDNILTNSMRINKNIIWETTGRTIDYTTNAYIKLAKEYKYEIVVVFPILKTETQIARCKNRKQAADCDSIPTSRKISAANFPSVAKISDIILIYYNEEKPLLIYDSRKSNHTELLHNDKDIAPVYDYMVHKFGSNRYRI